MKKLLLSAFICLAAQYAMAQTTTIILLRHAEKDTSTAGSTSMQANPPLSRQGEQRAAGIPKLLAGYAPDAIYSTNYNRTKATVAPLAASTGKQVQLYDPRNLAGFAAELKAMEGKTIVVAGHSNTTPALVNLLIGEKRYPDLDESVYNRYFIVTLKDGKASSQSIDY